MAETEKKQTQNTKKNTSLIDPIYQKFAKGVIRAIGSTEFYEFFMDSVSKAQNEIQFSNRKMVKTVDLNWVDSVEEALEAMQNIISSPRNVIKEEELIVNVAQAKRANSETVRHLAQHTNLIEDFNESTGDVRPARLMQRFREDSVGLYENRLVYTTMEYAYRFVKIRHDALMEAMSDEFGAKLKLETDMDSATEHVHLDMFLHIKEIDSALQTDEKHSDVFSRISRIYRVLSVFMNSPFAKQLAKLPAVKGTVHKTNVLKKNKDYKSVLKLFEFLRHYDDIGYTIKIVEQNPEISETFQRDIFHNVMFNYLILKGYLEDEEDRAVPAEVKGRKRTLKPKFIHQIVEELTEDYDLPDVEIRKVLIEELTKEQLMQEEAAERRRLVEEAEQRKKEEEERLKAEKRAEEERIKAEKAAEKERLRLEKEAEEARLRAERMEREMEDRRRSKIFKSELLRFSEELSYKLECREKDRLKKEEEFKKFEDAVRLREEAEARRLEEIARDRLRTDEEREQLRIEREREKAEAERAVAEEKERIRREREEAEAAAAREQREKDMAALAPYIEEITFFNSNFVIQQRLRLEYEEDMVREKEERDRVRRERAALSRR